MALLKRRTAADAEITAAPADEPYDPRATGGKGRPTPKRAQARASRPKGGSSLTATKGKARTSGAKGDRRRQTNEYRAAMQSGDISKLPPRERAPERVLARDYVDRRRNIGPYFLIAAAVYFVGAIVPVSAVRLGTTVVMIAAMLAVITDSVVLSVVVTRAVGRAHPGSKVGVRAYSIQRALLPRRWRLPKPRVSRAQPATHG
jgi:Protein of unknown function (DUF3043)